MGFSLGHFAGGLAEGYNAGQDRELKAAEQKSLEDYRNKSLEIDQDKLLLEQQRLAIMQDEQLREKHEAHFEKLLAQDEAQFKKWAIEHPDSSATVYTSSQGYLAWQKRLEHAGYLANYSASDVRARMYFAPTDYDKQVTKQLMQKKEFEATYPLFRAGKFSEIPDLNNQKIRGYLLHMQVNEPNFYKMNPTFQQMYENINRMETFKGGLDRDFLRDSPEYRGPQIGPIQGLEPEQPPAAAPAQTPAPAQPQAAPQAQPQSMNNGAASGARKVRTIGLRIGADGQLVETQNPRTQPIPQPTGGVMPAPGQSGQVNRAGKADRGVSTVPRGPSTIPQGDMSYADDTVSMAGMVPMTRPGNAQVAPGELPPQESPPAFPAGYAPVPEGPEIGQGYNAQGQMMAPEPPIYVVNRLRQAIQTDPQNANEYIRMFDSKYGPGAAQTYVFQNKPLTRPTYR